MRKIILSTGFLIILLVLFYACAKVVAPTGGEKDELPPKIVISEPQNKATNFQGKKIKVKFDEYIKLNNVSQELIATPLMQEQPEVKLRGKYILIEIKDSLEENITYNFNFNNAIEDVNEGNILKNYQFVFSTGDEIDTLFVVGHVYNAFDLEPAEGVNVMLYRAQDDSVPKTQKPYYYTKTDEEGVFSLNNLAPGSYKLFALKDANRNLLFDQPSEPIAFIDTLVSPKVKLAEIFDTVQVFNPEDSTMVDSIYSKTVVVPATNELHLMLFTEDFENQYIVESKRDDPKKLSIIFNRGLKDSVHIEPLNFDPEKDWYIYESNPAHDSLIIWIRDSSIYLRDSVYLSLEYKNRDSLENWIPETDSVNFLFVEKEEKKDSRRNRRKQEEDTVQQRKPSELKLTFSARNFAEYGLSKPLHLAFNYPISNVDTRKVGLFEIEDTIENPIEFTIHQDSMRIRKYTIQAELNTEMSYKCIVDSGAFFDIYGNINDSSGVTFKVKALEKYSIINLKIEKNETPGILQLLDTKENILRELPIAQNDSLVILSLLKANTYLLKYIVDRNDNKKWDTGDYDQQLQPEPVYYYPEEISVKENWDYDINWNILE